MNKWEHQPAVGIAQENYVLSGEGFYISYNPNTSDAFHPFFSGNGSETALCVNYKFYILSGDWRNEYEKALSSGLEACMKVYEDNKEDFRCVWSTDWFEDFIKSTEKEPASPSHLLHPP